GVVRENRTQQTRGFERIEGEVTHMGSFGALTRLSHRLRFFAGASHDAPVQRSIGLVALDATDTYTDDFLRGRNALFARSDVHYAVPGGAGLRGYSPLLRVDRAASLNGELAAELLRARAKSMVPAVQLVGFGDAAWGKLSGAADVRIFADAGVGILASDQLWDRRVTVRFDVPLYVKDPRLSVGDNPGGDRVKLRWTFSFADLW